MEVLNVSGSRRRTPEDYERERREKRLRKRRKARRRKRIVMFFVIMFVVIVVGFGTFEFAKKMMSTPQSEITAEENNTNTETAELTGNEIEVVIPEGATTKDIATILKENNLIYSVLKFRWDSKMNDFDGTYKQGTYLVSPTATSLQMMEMFQKGPEIDGNMKLTIPEGFTVEKIAARLEEKGTCTAQEFIDEVQNGDFQYEFLKDLPTSAERKYRLEGYLFPDTYFLTKDITPHEIIDKMLTRFGQELTDDRRKAITESGFTLDEIVTIASIIDAEIQVPEERKRASGVIRNRLAAEMPLQMDATVNYANGVVKEDVLLTDLEVDSPYNTYKNTGLPIGPIGNPGADALSAAIYPEENNYLYYVVEAKGQGNHIFTETYDEFLKAKEAYKSSDE